MNRNELRELALIRLKEAKSLLNSRNYEGAYYLCGYAVECGLKACIAKKTNRHDFPDKNTVNESYTHELSKLLRLAGLDKRLNDASKKNKTLEVNWSVVKDWREDSRYKRFTDKDAVALYSAINGKHGVLRWIKLYW